MRIQNNSHKKKILGKALIIMAIMTTIMITMALLLVNVIVPKDNEIKISKQQYNGIKASYSSLPNSTWDISENGDGSVVATLSGDGTLTISGTGRMKDWDGFGNTEWHEVKEQVKSVIIEEGVTSIGWYAFDRCRSLTSIDIPNSVTNIGYFAFGECTSLTSVKIPNSVTTINAYTFIWCTNLTSIEIPNGVTNINHSAFRGCSSLTSINIPNSLTNIGDYAFYECISLTNIEIPSSVTSIGWYAFNECTSLTSINVDKNNKYYMDDNGVLYTKDGSELIKCPGGKKEAKYSILVGTTRIREYAFEKCTLIANIEIPNSVTSIGDWAFAECTNLTNIEIPDSVTSIVGLMFYECTSLTNIVIPNSVTSIEWNAFEGCTSLTDIMIPDSVTNIEPYAFERCTNLVSIKIPNSVTTIEDYVFYGCTNLTNIEIPNTVTNIGWDTFNGCTSLTNINIPNSVTSIEGYAFNECTNLTSIEIPNSVTNIGWHAFNGCTNLAKIVIPTSVNRIGGNAFKGCPSLTIYCTNYSYAKQYAINNNIKYVIDDEVPTITSVIGNPTQWTNKDITLTINAEDSVVGLAEKPYSFDNGRTWQAENTKIYASNSAGIIIKVKDKLNNIYTHDVVHVLKIDKQAPIISNVTGNPIQWTNKDVTLTITAKDSFSGLDPKPYSFDGGKTWQAENTKTFTKNTAGIIIKVRDKAGNVTTYNKTINIKKIDKQVPIIRNVISTPTQWKVKEVTITINALDSFSGLDTKPYSFDGGRTWQAENTKKFNRNAAGIIIKVRDKAGNIATYSPINIDRPLKLELHEEKQDRE